MSDTNELQAAVERLRRVKAGEDIEKIYRTEVRPPKHKTGKAWTITDAKKLARSFIHRDHETLADAYLALGTRQPDVYAVYLPPGVTMRDESLEAIRRDFPHLKGIVREVTFIQEIPEVPNAE